MSGGHFNYNQWRIRDIAEQIDELIKSNDDETLDEWGDRRGRGYSPETIERFREAVAALRVAAIYAQRVDWLVSGDDGEEAFHKRLQEELNEARLG